MSDAKLQQERCKVAMAHLHDAVGYLMKAGTGAYIQSIAFGASELTDKHKEDILQRRKDIREELRAALRYMAMASHELEIQELENEK